MALFICVVKEAWTVSPKYLPWQWLLSCEHLAIKASVLHPDPDWIRHQAGKNGPYENKKTEKISCFKVGGMFSLRAVRIYV
jgi:hypothetical protein